MFVYIHLYKYTGIHTFAGVFLYVSTQLHMYVSVDPSVYPSVSLSACRLCVCLPVFLSAYLLITYLSD